MKRNRLLVLSSLAFIASGALVFACSGNGDDDAGIDSGTKDAKSDTTTTSDAKNDTTTTDTGTDTGTDAGSDAASDASDASDAISDAGTALTFMVLRAGGSVDAGADAALNNSSTPVFLEERNVSDGSLVRTIPLPTAVNGNNQPFAISGTSTSEGALSNSADGHYVLIGGFAAAPGVASIAKTTTDGGTLRVVARVDKAGNVDTTTELGAYDQTDIRGATADDGGAFWTTGASASDAGNTGFGVQYVTLGSTGASTTVGSPPTNTRVAAIFGGQLYVSSAFTPFNGVFTVGTGEPTSAATSTLLPGFAGDAGGSPYGFSLMDLDASVAGLDTLYLADDSNPDAGGGIQKWVFNGTTWTNVTTFVNGLPGKTGFFGVATIPTSSGVIIIATVNVTSGTEIIKYVDDGVNTPTATRPRDVGDGHELPRRRPPAELSSLLQPTRSNHARLDDFRLGKRVRTAARRECEASVCSRWVKTICARAYARVLGARTAHDVLV